MEAPPVSPFSGESLEVIGARVHNLKALSVHIPRHRFVVITGISGSGKSSLAFDTIYAEGQRRYMESFSAYARQFIGDLERPDVEHISGLSPVISIEQKTTSKNPRSTVGTVTEIYDFLRLLFARAGEAFSYATGNKMVRFTGPQILEHLLDRYSGKRIVLLAPMVKGRKGHYRELFEQVLRQGFLKVRVDGEMLEVREKMQVDRFKVHDIEVVVDRLRVDTEEKDRLENSLSTTLRMGKGLAMVMDFDTGEIKSFSEKLMDAETGLSYEEPSPNTFSFNSPYGACPHCKGLGIMHEINEDALISDPKKSLSDGGLAPLGEFRDNLIFKQLRSLGKQYGFTLGTRVQDLSREALNAILYGSAEGKVEVEMDYGSGDRWYTLEFGGVVDMIKRSFEFTSSEGIRRWAEGFMEVVPCPECNGTRLKKESLYFKIAGKDIAELSQMNVDHLYEWLLTVEDDLSERQRAIARELLKELRIRVQFLLDVGLEYLSLDRPARSLSGGESQRIRLATQIGSKLSGITYILDEPSIGLHQRDNRRLIRSLRELRDAGNTVLVVEHDREIMESADYLIDLGPGAGEHGGEVVAAGSPEEVRQAGSLTARYLRNEMHIPVPAQRSTGTGKQLVLKGATGNNLKDVDLIIPLGTFTCVTGVSGSGKSTLINETLYPILNSHFYRARKRPLPYRSIEGLQHLDKVIEIDQSPIGRTPRSNPSTYIGVFSDIRKLFTEVPESKIRGYKPGRFSFNVKGGRCEVCEGAGLRLIEMNFLPDVYVECEQCHGRRYNRETLEVHFKNKNISDVLDMTVEEALAFFEAIPSIHHKLHTLNEVGLGYIRLGQPSTTLSGGEAQRVKLAAELSKRDTGYTIYILDEPTTGLHFEDIRVLLDVLARLVDKGNTVIVIEHNLDVIKVADHIIDLGPEGGDKGGRILASGTPEHLAAVEESYTGQFLRDELAR
jgi:excinuclease ABC subunit A